MMILFIGEVEINTINHLQLFDIKIVIKLKVIIRYYIDINMYQQ